MEDEGQRQVRGVVPMKAQLSYKVSLQEWLACFRGEGAIWESFTKPEKGTGS